MNEAVKIEKLQAEYEAVNTTLAELKETLKSYANDSRVQIEKTGKMSEELKLEVDKALSEQTGFVTDMNEVRQMLAKIQNGPDGPAASRSLGASIANEEFMAGLQGMAGGMKKTHGISVQYPMNQRPMATVIDSSATSGGAAIQPARVPGITPLGTRRLQVRDLFSVAPISSTNAIEFVRETGFTNAAAPVSENPASAKPESAITFEVASAAVATIAHIIPATKQVLDDASIMAGYIDTRMRYGVQLEEEEQLLLGSGAGLNINGVVTQATTYSNPGLTPTSETVLDRLRLAMLQVQLADYPVDGIVINPLDWARIEMLKDSQNQYLIGNPQGNMASNVWGLPVVATNTMTADEFLVGSFAMGGTVWDRELLNVAISTENNDDFEKNMVTIRAEERVALTIYRPESFVTGSFNDLTSS